MKKNNEEDDRSVHCNRIDKNEHMWIVGTVVEMSDAQRWRFLFFPTQANILMFQFEIFTFNYECNTHTFHVASVNFH